VVTAVDEAGNESAPSNSAYLNFDLLPVSSIAIEQIDAQKPVLSWTHPGGSLAGFNVSMGPVGQAVQINDSPLTDLSATDTGYAGDVREYSVIALDPNAVQSPARTIMLPRVDAEPVAGSRLLRGIMNKLEYTVVNSSLLLRLCSLRSNQSNLNQGA
jgi:hypothetical protein